MLISEPFNFLPAQRDTILHLSIRKKQLSLQRSRQGDFQYYQFRNKRIDLTDEYAHLFTIVGNLAISAASPQ